MPTSIVTPDNLGTEFALGTDVPSKISLRLGKGLALNQAGKICVVGGVVDSAGSLLRSSGLAMTSARLAKGLYQVSFTDPPGANNYAIHLTLMRPNNADDLSIWYTNVLPDSFSVEIRRQDNGAAAGGFFDNGFSFLVIA